jgi:hypothetical protein
MQVQPSGLQRLALLLTYPHDQYMLLTEKTSCVSTSMSMVLRQVHCKPLAVGHSSMGIPSHARHSSNL